MKKIATFFLLLFFSLTSYSTTYYFSAKGNDANSGTSSSSPWQSLNKFNSISWILNPGDNVLFNRGDEFYGSIIIRRSGTFGSPITIGAYGSGAKPVITGLTTVVGWNSLGNNKWESSGTVSSLSYTNMVVVNGVNTAMGRFPNTGTLPYESYSNGTSITSSALSGYPNWTGAELAMYISTYDIGRNLITAQSGGTLTYEYSSKDGAIQYAPGWFYPSFFIQNDPKTLDAQNEWYFNPSTKKIQIYSSGTPLKVQLSTIDKLVSIDGFDFITFDNISFQGSNIASVFIRNSKYNTIRNCDFNFSGKDAIFGPYHLNSTGLKIENCSINNSNNTAIDLSGDFDNATIQYNSIQNSGMLQGMGSNGSDNGTGSYGGIYALGTNLRIQYNTIENVGYIGIKFSGNNSSVNNNYISNFCKVLIDGGGIYTSNGSGNNNSNMKILNNIVLNSTGGIGIYIDEKSNGIEVSGNSVANCNLGLYLHNNWNIKANNNTTFNNGFTHDGTGFLFDNYDPNVSTSNIEIKGNIFFAKTIKQNTGYYSLKNGIIPSTLDPDNNYYARPIDDSKAIFTNLNKVYSYKTLSEWKAISGKDGNSKASPKNISDVNDLRFEYNATTSSKTISLDANYIDVKGQSYNGTITLAPYTSAVLIKNGPSTNQAPKANAGSDQTIILPINSISLSGSGSSSNGSISAYNWTMISGPSQGTITNANSASTTVTSMVQGFYQFQLKVTDNSGAVGMDTVQITVNALADGSLLPAIYPANTVNGIDYSYYEGVYDVVPAFSTLSPVKTGSVNNFDISIAGRAEDYAINFTGYVNVPADGQYTFYINSDDGSKLYIDNKLVVDNDGWHGPVEKSGAIGLKAGKHVITVGYLQKKGGSLLSVSYEGAGISKQAIPASALYRNSNVDNGLLPAVNPANTVNGIDYSYYEGVYDVVPAFSTLSPVKTGSVNNFDITIASRAEDYAINFTGYVNVPADGQYTFYINSDDGSKLYIDNKLVVDNDGWHGPVEKSGAIGLKAGKHVITVGYLQKKGGSLLSVSYEGAGISKQAIPASALYRNSNVDNGLLPAVNPANTVNGIAYSYYEGVYDAVPAFSTLSPVKTGSVNNFDISLSNRLEAFSINFTGYVNVPTDGQYTFYVNSDDGSKLYIDNVLVVDNDGLHGNLEKAGTIGLKAGKHAISVGYFQKWGGSLLAVSYGGAGISKQAIPASALYRILNVDNGLLPAVNPANTVNGIDYSYYEGVYDAVPAFSTLSPVKTGSVNNFDISLSNRLEAFSINFTGYVNVPADGQYTFYVNSDDGSKLYIDNVLVVDNDGLHGNLEKSGTIGLKAGKHVISVGYFQKWGGSLLTVSYAGAGISKQFIPASSLYRVSVSATNISAIAGTSGIPILSSTQAGIKVYPNPFANSIVVNITGNAGDYSLTVFDVSGKLLWVKKGTKNNGSFQQRVNTSSLQKGVYFLKIIQNDKVSVIKLEK